MVISAGVAGARDRYLATLSDGQRLERPDLRALAQALHGAGVSAGRVSSVRHPGQPIITAGQEVALVAEIRKLEGHSSRDGP
ncbi:MAG: hypothetical protein KA603_10695 [Azonexus sp.]|jgi:hypothetical protein|nr:hypothetical protein [Betaproteobacteria bacterium]MBK8919088.1 hypothetical protein [Betaproteobacteria bacterium]MBP6036590.1 hypothetical protein [Azonexus sp.]MBP6907199.1 hypothetical protein [Azonexus sp.]